MKSSKGKSTMPLALAAGTALVALAISGAMAFSGHGVIAYVHFVVSLLLCILVFVVIASGRGTFRRVTVLEKIIDMMDQSVVLTNGKADIKEVNRAFTATTGFDEAEVIGKNPRIMKSGRHGPEFYQKMWADLKAQGSWEGEIWDRRKSGEVYPKWLSIAAIKKQGNRDFLYAGVFSDITTVKQASEQLEYLLNHDRLTGLGNRTALFTAIARAGAESRAAGTKAALLLVDINRFKGVNSAFGFSGGDALLREMAKRLREAAGPEAFVARTGSNEFTVLAGGLKGPGEAASLCQAIITRVQDAFILNGQHLFIGINIGASVMPEDTKSSEKLPGLARAALSSARGKGTNHFVFYDPAIDRDVRDNLQIETNLRLALKEQEFILLYQPLLSMRTGEVYGVEALIRRVEREALISPGFFIEVAEESGLILDICEWTLKEAARQHVMWLDEGLRPIAMSVNTTAMQFHQERILPKVREVLKETGMRAEHLKLEVTEGTVMKNAEGILRQLRELKAMGIMLSLDDFGTGYSSLGYLRRFPVDIIKIDISFVREIGKSPEGETVVRAVIDLAHNLGFRALAEGVETKEQLDFLMDLDCDLMQGFYFGKPVPAEMFAKDLASDRRLF